MQDTSQAQIHDPARLATSLTMNLDRLPQPVFAVFDGSVFDDLEDDLEAAGIACRSLFLDGGNPDIRRDGPWLVALDDTVVREHVEALALETPCAVFWSCPDGEQALWRHLRTINEILIPDPNVAATGERIEESAKYERVLFRHWDPKVLSELIPMLGGPQLARLLGPAQALLMYAGGGLRRARRPDDVTKPSSSLLTLDAAQLDALENRMQSAYCERMGKHLRAMAPQETAAMTDGELHEHVMRYEASGNRLGIGQERSLALWGFLMLSSRDRFDSNPEIQAFIRSGPGTPDENVETLMHQMTRLANTFGEVA